MMGRRSKRLDGDRADYGPAREVQGAWRRNCKKDSGVDDPPSLAVRSEKAVFDVVECRS